MKHKQIKIILGLAFFLIISNIPPFQSVLKFIFDDNLYYYSTKDGSAFFMENEYKGRKFQFKRVTSAEKEPNTPKPTQLFIATSNLTFSPFGAIGTTFLMNDIPCLIFHWKKQEKRGRNGRKK
jgi:hypothetical protein